MCDFSDKLVAWLDRELSMDEASYVERHLGVCSECRTRMDAYRKISVALGAYYEAVSTPSRRRVAPLRALAGIGAAAALVLFLVRPHTRVEKPLVVPPMVSSQAIAREAAPSPIKQVRRRHSPTLAHNAPVHWVPSEQGVLIAIPAEALFPPGAAPEGVNFVADLSIAPDGSAQRLRFEPQLIGLERSR
jgi:anti-sigma factor RsiW